MVTSVGEQIWKETYGFDFVSRSPGDGANADPTMGYKNCLKAEYSKFARKCRKKGGLIDHSM